MVHLLLFSLKSFHEASHLFYSLLTLSQQNVHLRRIVLFFDYQTIPHLIFIQSSPFSLLPNNPAIFISSLKPYPPPSSPLSLQPPPLRNISTLPNPLTHPILSPSLIFISTNQTPIRLPTGTSPWPLFRLSNQIRTTWPTSTATTSAISSAHYRPEQRKTQTK